MLFGVFLTALFYTRVLGSLVSLSIALLALRFRFFFLGVSGLSFDFSFSFSLGSLIVVLSSITSSVAGSSLVLFSFSLVVFSFLLGLLGGSPVIFFSLLRASSLVAKALN